MPAGALPEAKLVNREILLRDMQLSKEVRLTQASLVRWLAIALGLISPNESRRAMLPVFQALLHFQLGEKRDPDIHEIIEFVEKAAPKTANEKSIRYHLWQLKNTGLIERKKGRYYFAVAPTSEKYNLKATVDHIYERGTAVALSKIGEALDLLAESYRTRKSRI